MSSTGSIIRKISNLKDKEWIRRRFTLLVEEIFPSQRPKRLLRSFPRLIQIETCSQCNGKCIICPYPEFVKKIRHGIMSMTIFKRLIDEISKHQIELIDLFNNNEPLLDPHLNERLQYTKEKVPQAILKLDTNAVLLNTNIIDKITDYVDIFLVSVHGSNKETYEKIMPGFEFEKTVQKIEELAFVTKKKGKSVVINCVLIKGSCSADEIKSFWAEKGINVNISHVFDRAGNLRIADKLSVRKNKRKPKGCWLRDFPLTKIVIQWDGQVTLCCQDWSREYIMGDVSVNTISEIWHNHNFREVRKALYSNGKSPKADLCVRCNNPFTFYEAIKGAGKVWYEE